MSVNCTVVFNNHPYHFILQSTSQILPLESLAMTDKLGKNYYPYFS